MHYTKMTAQKIILVVLLCCLSMIIFFSFNNKGLNVKGFVKSNFTVSEKAFGSWVNDSKYLSIDDLKDNMLPNSMIVFGSSEFNHLNESMGHPTHAFQNVNSNVMLIGTAYNQSLSMATYLGALEPTIDKKKVTLILSAAWFYKKGVTSHDYTKRFSEGAYIAFMENPNISLKEKKYLENRTKRLLEDDNLKKKVVIYNKVLLYKKGTEEEKKYVLSEKEKKKNSTHKALMAEYNKAGIGLNSKEIFSYDENYTPPWDQIIKASISYDKTRRNNKYYIDDGRWEIKYKVQMPGLKGGQVKSSFAKSPEYDDLRLFLDICKDHNIEVLLVVQPQNGYWYDDTGLTVDKRKVFPQMIKKVAEKYDAKVATYSEFEYEKYFCWDPLHLAGEGWTRVSRDIYNFYNK